MYFRKTQNSSVIRINNKDDLKSYVQTSKLEVYFYKVMALIPYIALAWIIPVRLVRNSLLS